MLLWQLPHTSRQGVGGLFFVTLKDDYQLDGGEVSPRGKHALPFSRFPAKNRPPGTQSTLVIPCFPLLFYVMFFFYVSSGNREQIKGMTFSKEEARKSTLVECQPGLQISTLGCVTQGSI